MKRSARYHAGHMFYAATSLGLDDVTKACVKAEAEIRLFVLLLYIPSHADRVLDDRYRGADRFPK
jgi:hypothetical protein